MTLKDLGKAFLITAGIFGAIVTNQLARNYEKFGRVLPVKSIEIPYTQPIDGDKIVSKIGRDWDKDGNIDEIVTTYEIPKIKVAGTPFRYSFSEIPFDSKFYKNIEYRALD